ncbi:hypothetical protein ABZW30_38485 [Kitasatospora sp. NPDC004669]|uniref:hypothetical protein n=1 Tax=Kitasatospora sp. NPDC004669 TaxID=3154555 RepID=UPI0033B2BDE6
MAHLLSPHAAESKFAHAALNDLEKKRLTVKHGTGEDGRDIWGMTTAGRNAAQALFPDGRDIGGIAPKAGAGSAVGHAPAVSETVIGFVAGGACPVMRPGASSFGQCFAVADRLPV